MLHDIVLVWPGLCNKVAPQHAHLFDLQDPTCHNVLQQDGQMHATCCAQQSCNTGGTFCQHVAIVWAGLANTGPTMLQYIGLKCCNHSAGA